MRSPRDWATRAVAVAKAEKRRKRVASGGWPVIQYTMLQYAMGQITWRGPRKETTLLDPWPSSPLRHSPGDGGPQGPLQGQPGLLGQPGSWLCQGKHISIGTTL